MWELEIETGVHESLGLRFLGVACARVVFAWFPRPFQELSSSACNLQRAPLKQALPLSEI